MQASPDQFRSALAAAALTAEASDPPATLSYANRPIIEFRATVLARTPSLRVSSVTGVLDQIVADGSPVRLTTEAFPEGSVISAGSRRLFIIWPADVDVLSGENLDTKVATAVSRLQLALDETRELRNPSRVGLAILLALVATVVFVIAIGLLRKLHRVAPARVSRTAQRQLERLPGGEIVMRATDAPANLRRAFMLLSLILGLILTYAWATFVLRRFPYTRPWGESLRSVMLSSFSGVGRRMVDALPDVLVVVVIFLVTRFLIRVVQLIFDAVEHERIKVPWLFPETAQPTRRIVSALLWLFALIVSYSYLPGSDSDAFKGVSVFVGLMVSLGSTGIMNQVMSGFTITYSRALRVGDFVKIGDIEGTVTHLGTLSTKVKTVRNEEVTLPNAIVVSQATTNYTRFGTDGVFFPTSITIGYDVPWRQIHALMLLAAERTPGIRAEPKPVVRQAALEDFYVKYTLLVALEQPQLRAPLLDALHGNIQDAFNEYGVQIMSPNYEADPSGPKVVAPDQWYAAPAVAPADPARVQTTQSGR